MTEQTFDLRTTWATLRAWLRTEAGVRVMLALILVVGAYLRLSHINWDMGTHIHPDERFLTMVESALEIPKSLGEFFDSTKSPMNPYNKGFGLFVYGTLPIFIVRIVAEVANKFNQATQLWTFASGAPIVMTGYDGVHLVGRVLSGLFDLAGVWLIFIIGRRLYGRKVGLVAAALLAFAVLPLQQSHFFTVDTFSTFFALLTIYFAVRVAQGGAPAERPSSEEDVPLQREANTRGYGDGGWLSYLGLGVSLGASVASRINLAPLAGIALLAAGIRLWDDWHAGRRSQAAGRRSQAADPKLATGEGAWLGTLIQATLFRLLLMGIVAIAVFRVAQPYAFGGTSLLDFSFAQKWLDNMREVSRLIGGEIDYPPAHQWTSRTPFVFPWVNMVVWGMGLPLGLTAWAGWALAAWQIVRGLTGSTGHVKWVRLHLLPVVWIGGLFLYHSIQFSYTMRYYLPIYPLLALMAAWLLWWLVDRARELGSRGAEEQGSSGRRAFEQRLPRVAVPVFLRATYALLALVVIGTMLWGWGFLAIYRRPLTRITASRWIYANVPPGSRIGNEHWDDGLPMPIDGKNGFGSFGYRGLPRADGSDDGQVEMYWEDMPEKREQLYKWLNAADYLVLSSNRLWGSIPRLPMRYPMATLYYKLLFEGKLGFEQVLHVTSFPTIFGIQFNDTGAEEAFSVYDHPEVYIFKKTPAYSEALARSYFDQVDLENTIQMWPKQVSAAPTALLMTEDEAARQRAGGTWTDIFDEEGLTNRLPLLFWLLLLELLGVIAFPFAFVILRGLSDRGYGVSKTLGMLLLAWLSWLGPSLKLLPYQRWSIALMLGLLVGAAAGLAWRRRATIMAFVRQRGSLLLTEEVLFLVLFGLFLLIRIGNPDLWHPARGGEKPMNFAYLNAVIKSTTFPPYDPWHAGGFMNYYYFGYVIVGTLIKLTGIVPWVAYNLAVPTLFALTGLGAFAVAYSLAEGNKVTRWQAPHPACGVRDKVTEGETVSPGQPVTVPPGHSVTVSGLFAGLAATFFVAIIGNLGNVKLLFDQWATHSTLQFQSNIPGFAKLVRGLAGAWGMLSGKQPLNFPNDWWFWNASRVIPDTINEFPFFTFTYADLHAHMIALPLTLLGLAIAVALVRIWDLGFGISDFGPRSVPVGFGTSDHEPSPWRIPLSELLLIALLGLVLGALRATNTWDFPTYLLIGLIALGVLEAVRRSHMPFPEMLDEQLAFLFRAAVSVLWRMVILFAVASVTFYPYTKYYATAYAGLQTWKEATTKIPDYLTVHGFFLAVITIYLISEWVAQARERRIPAWLENLAPFIITVLIVLLGLAVALKVQIWLIALPLAALATALAMGRDLPPARRLALLLIALGLAITMGVEVVRQKDDIGRMNTVFKFYVQAWVLFGVGSAFGLTHWAERSRRWVPAWRRLAWAITIVLFAGAMLYPLTAARAKVRDRFSEEASPRGLDGMAYMDKAQFFDNNRDMRLADDKAAILWMLHNVTGSPVILEGNTPGYRWGSRYSIYTGLPDVQGWDWHQKQQRSVVPHTEIDRRLAHVREIYDTADLERARHLLDLYKVSYIIVGELERAYYNPQGLAKFDTLVGQGYLRLAYEGGTVRIYEVVGRAATAMPAAAPSSKGSKVETPEAPTAGALKAEPPMPPEATLPAVQPFESPQK